MPEAPNPAPEYVRTLADLVVGRFTGATWPLVFIYTNHKGEVDARHAEIRHISFATSSWHGPEPHWIARGWCTARREIRDFAMANMRPVSAMGLMAGQERAAVAMLRALAARYMATVSTLTTAEAFMFALATWETEWPCDRDPAPRTVADALEAAAADMSYWEE